jgi:hypothetical protein
MWRILLIPQEPLTLPHSIAPQEPNLFNDVDVLFWHLMQKSGVAAELILCEFHLDVLT